MLNDITATENDVWELWHRRILTARSADNARADAVENLIQESRQIITQAGYALHSDHILAQVYFALHWDCGQPTDRVFETMLAFELESFFNERMN